MGKICDTRNKYKKSGNMFHIDNIWNSKGQVVGGVKFYDKYKNIIDFKKMVIVYKDTIDSYSIQQKKITDGFIQKYKGKLYFRHPCERDDKILNIKYFSYDFISKDGRVCFCQRNSKYKRMWRENLFTGEKKYFK